MLSITHQIQISIESRQLYVVYKSVHHIVQFQVVLVASLGVAIWKQDTIYVNVINVNNIVSLKKRITRVAARIGPTNDLDFAITPSVLS